MWRTFDAAAVIESLSDDARVVAGADGLARQVSRAKIAASVEPLRRTRRDDH